MIISVRNLLRRPRRNILTLTGVVVAAASYMVLVASGAGLIDQFRLALAVLGGEIVVQQAGATSPKSSWLTPEQVVEIEACPGVASVLEVAIATTRFEGGFYFVVFGVDPGRRLMKRLHVVQGRTLNAGVHDEMLLGHRAAERLEIEQGELLGLGGKRLRVVGIYDTGRPILDSGAIMELGVVQRIFNHGDRVNMVFAEVDASADPTLVQEEIQHRLPEVDASSGEAWLADYRQLELVERFARYLAAAALLIAALGIANTLSLSIGERVQELAILRAVGWSRWKVARMVLLEGTLLSAFGGVLGVPCARLALVLLGPLHQTGFVPSGIPVRIAAEGIVLAIVAGALGSFPAILQALRLKPARGLRTF